MWFALLLAIPTDATAAEPWVDPRGGRFAMRILADQQITIEEDADCPRGGRCGAAWDRADKRLEFEVALAPGVAVYGDLGRRAASVEQAAYKGVGYAVGGGVRLALPLKERLALAADGRFEYGHTGGTDGLDDPADSVSKVGTVGGYAVLGDPANGFSFWAGPEGAVYWDHHLKPFGEIEPVLDLDMNARYPMWLALGAAARSQPLGLPWATSTRLSFGMRVEAFGTRGLGAWVGAHW